MVASSAWLCAVIEQNPLPVGNLSSLKKKLQAVDFPLPVTPVKRNLNSTSSTGVDSAKRSYS